MFRDLFEQHEFLNWLRKELQLAVWLARALAGWLASRLAMANAHLKIISLHHFCSCLAVECSNHSQLYLVKDSNNDT